MKCDKCDAVFHMTSNLSRHQYHHEKPRYHCTDCRKPFFFTDELKQHCTSHLKVKIHACNHGCCNHRFMNKPDLLKHVQTHTNKLINCPKCDYETTDPRLYKNH